MAELTPTETDVVTDDEVVAYLTSFADPIERWCLLAGDICFWAEKARMVLSLRCRRTSLACACRHYLTARGWVYQSMAELGQHAAQFNWPDWSKERQV